MRWGRIAGGALVASLGALAGRYAARRRRIERSWLPEVDRRLASIGEVDRLSVLPIVERLATSPLAGEPGVSYLLRTERATLLFDAGLNGPRRPRAAFAHNAEALGVDVTRLDGIVISHLHADHVGGFGSQRQRTFRLTGDSMLAKGVPAYVPAPMTHERAETLLTSAPRVIAPGIALLPPLPAMMFWLGPVAEQALVVNVRGFGLVLVSGCGHPTIERMLAVTERVLDVSIKGVIGGLHLPVHPLGTPLLPQATLGNPNWPWQPIGERDVEAAIRELTSRGPRLVAVSSHDSTPWTYDAFGRAFGNAYRTLHVGDAIEVTAGGASLPSRTTEVH